jgi:hypothetical protein
VANYIHEISTRHRRATAKERFHLPVIRVNPAAPMAAPAEGCA